MTFLISINFRNEDETISFVRNELAAAMRGPEAVDAKDHGPEAVDAEDRGPEAVDAVVSESALAAVVIVNNGATDQSTSRLCSELDAVRIDDIGPMPRKAAVYVIHRTDNQGFARGNNLAASFVFRHFEPDFLVFSNTDIKFLSENTLPAMQSYLESHPGAGIVGPRIVGLDGGLQSPVKLLPFWTKYVTKTLFSGLMSKKSRTRRFALDYAENAVEGPADMVMGSFFMADAKAFRDCGMMDPETFLYYEEFILAQRMKAIGRSVDFLPSVKVVHAHGTTIRKYNSFIQMEKIALKSAKHFYRRYMDTPSWKLRTGSWIYLAFTYYRALKSRLK